MNDDGLEREAAGAAHPPDDILAHRARGSISAGSNVSPLTGASETGGQSGDGSRERRDDALLIGVPHVLPTPRSAGWRRRLSLRVVCWLRSRGSHPGGSTRAVAAARGQPWATLPLP